MLVIFDCCHAGELERNVRSAFTRRAFEFLAATSAKSTTRKPGPHSFTSALIWSLSHLVEKEKEGFSTQELLRTIQHEAPDFPEHQSPRLSERRPASLRKILLAPLTRESVKKAMENSEIEDDEDHGDEVRQDLLLRFVFSNEITDHTVEEVARHLGRLIREGEIKAKAVLWEGINLPGSFQFKNSMVAQGAILKFLNILDHNRKKSLGASPTEEAAPREISKPVSTQIPKTIAASGPPSVDESLVATPDPSRSTVEPEIGEDQGASHMKPITRDTLRDDISPTSGSNLRGRLTRTLRNATQKNRKRGHSANNGPDSDISRKRSKGDSNDESAKN